MLKTLGSIIMILGGATLVIFSFYNNHKEVMKIANKDTNRLKKYLKHKKLLNLIVGFCFVILGMISILNIYNGDLIWIMSLIILFFDRVIEFVIDKKHKEIN
ncbi:hypothetical protein [Clostridium botulinum]|uniref:DUF3784 domain-containing protein n=2 Tax=Clostridium botulinum TaxID=1491 RepID=A0AA43Y4U8_CLOBO|nr:hypothetical protein [Clostridium botulinum]EKN37079.1 hypothetical protein CFSAN001627_25631 [Clostridium botulinum CFSAN001627]APC80540.1 putative membrane protein [Clostridium botulinum]APC85407.1 putative membrane protein [Clostridium botulinum]APH22523.1 putative membrane protein [Clostridium botulinum]APQ70370.1 putative membrane protein [Clostridium botulinum]